MIYITIDGGEVSGISTDNEALIGFLNAEGIKIINYDQPDAEFDNASVVYKDNSTELAKVENQLVGFTFIREISYV